MKCDHNLNTFGHYKDRDYEPDVELQELKPEMVLGGEYQLELNHRYICPVYVLEKDSSYGYYVVMKWLEGMALNEFRRQNGLQLPTLRTLLATTPAKTKEELAEVIYRKMKVERESKREAGTRIVKVVNGVEYAFRWCPAGEFMMGSPEDELGRNDDEIQHHVTLTQGFWMLETQVTQAMWESVMGHNPSRFKGVNRPVEQVNWDDCQEFCWRLRSSGLNVQLPTEAQWEYACRAGTTTSLNSGENITSEDGYCDNLDEVGWYEMNSNNQTHPVGQKQPNAWGLYDMHGNVWEWCQDWADYYLSNSVTDPTGATLGADRVFRGGSWSNPARECRSAYRCYIAPPIRFNNLGFRLALIPSSM